MSPSPHEAVCRGQSLYTNKKGPAAQSSGLAHLGWCTGAIGGEGLLNKSSLLFSGYHPELEILLANESVPIVVNGVPGSPGPLSSCKALVIQSQQ